jgi:hypothetical protein
VCRFNTEDSEGVVMNENRASCIMPWVEAEGWVDLELSLDGGPFYWKGKFFVGKCTYCSSYQNVALLNTVHLMM